MSPKLCSVCVSDCVRYGPRAAPAAESPRRAPPDSGACSAASSPVPVPGQFLNRSRRCATHRQVRAERVTQDVHAAVLRQLRLDAPPASRGLHDLPRERLGRRPGRARARSAGADARASAAASRLVSGTCRSRPPFGVVTCPFQSDRRTQSCRFAEIDVAPLERDHLAAP